MFRAVAISLFAVFAVVLSGCADNAPPVAVPAAIDNKCPKDKCCPSKCDPCPNKPARKDNGCECKDCKDPNCPSGKTKPCVCDK